MVRLLHSASYAARVARLLLLLLAVASPLSLTAAGASGGHCLRHGASGAVHHFAADANHASMMDHRHSAAPSTLVAASDTACDHCPAERCAVLAPCAGGPNGVLAGAAPLLPLVAPRLLAERVRPLLFHSTVPAPPTPPPLEIA